MLDYVYEMALKWRVEIDKLIGAIEFLRKFGYLSETEDVTVEQLIEAVKIFQSLVGLTKVDGEIGPKTIRAIHQPRCGCSDASVIESREAINRWGPHNLTWFVRGRDTDLTAQVWDGTIDKALGQWSEVADLTFTKVNSENEAKLVFDVGSSSRESFCSPGGTLAWAYLPPRDGFDGQLLSKFDTAERWVTSGNGIHLLNVACHEIGHLLGLGHSEVRNALMAPYYNVSITKPQNNDDVRRMVQLYGEPTTPEPPAPEPPSDDKEFTMIIKGSLISAEGYRITKLQRR